MGYLTIDDVIKACKGRLLGEYDTSRQVIGAKVDSREVKPGNVFFAGKGERTDGFNFIGKAFEAGAACVVCEREPEEGMGPCILVEDAYQALRDVATAYRKRLTIPVVGITGSVGKTSTKEAIAAVLSAKYRVSKTEGNFNNQIGVPLTVMAITMEHEAAVVEMGISDFGEMDRLGKIVRPDVVLFTNIGPCHLENLKDLEVCECFRLTDLSPISELKNLEHLNVGDLTVSDISCLHSLVECKNLKRFYAPNMRNMQLDMEKEEAIFRSLLPGVEMDFSKTYMGLGSLNGRWRYTDGFNGGTFTEPYRRIREIFRYDEGITAQPRLLF